MLDAEEVRTFVQGTVHFFETATGHAATAAATTGRSFVIPINWRSYAANVVVCLQ